jgi:hypothetical protein
LVDFLTPDTWLRPLVLADTPEHNRARNGTMSIPDQWSNSQQKPGFDLVMAVVYRGLQPPACRSRVLVSGFMVP